jgi:sulfoxide reductase heme-binding subunit YedZ
MTVLKVALCVLAFVPAVTLWRDLERTNPQFIVAYDYNVWSLGIFQTGLWSFILLFATLVCTPLQRITGFRWPGEIRRTMGLLTFLWFLLHATMYVVVGQKWNWSYVWLDALRSPSRIPGWLSLILLVPLAITSTNGMVRWLGGKRWKNLHRLVYLAAALAVLHLAWVDHERSRGYSRMQTVLWPFLILMALRLALVAWRWKRARRSPNVDPSPTA